jgi:hypothetical protein
MPAFSPIKINCKMNDLTFIEALSTAALLIALGALGGALVKVIINFYDQTRN